MSSQEEKRKALATAVSHLEKQFGKGHITRRRDNSGVAEAVSTISTGSIALDAALGVGGFPCGRIAEIFGPESAGKSTLALHAIAEAQKSGGVAAFIDAEHALDPVYAERLGVDLDDLWICQPDTGEQALETADQMVRSGGLDVIVIDSVAALTPKAEIEGEMGDSLPGLQARLLSQACRKLAANIKRTNTVCIFINQLRMKIGVMFGSPETTTGGNALKFYSTVRLDIRRTGSVKKGDEFVGNETRCKVAKNKIAPPLRIAEFQVLYNEGISKESELIDLGVDHDLVKKSGAWYSAYGEQIGQGKDNAREYLKENPDIRDRLEKDVRAALGLDRVNKKTADSDEEPGNPEADDDTEENAREAS